MAVKHRGAEAAARRERAARGANRRHKRVRNPE